MTRQEEIAEWVKAAIADGWSAKPTYNEPIERAAKLNKDGWEVQMVARPSKSGRGWGNFLISAWGPDGLTVQVPYPYSWEKLVEGLRTCSNCDATDVETTRFDFAGRVCPGCRKVLKEKPGWTR